MEASRRLSIVLLVFLAASSVVGAVPMLLNPHGEPWQMPQSFLAHSPFHSYLIPGLILLGANGLFCLFVLTATLRRRPGYGWWIAAQGSILLGWLTVECAMIRFVVWPHYFYGAVALALIAAGLAQRNAGGAPAY